MKVNVWKKNIYSCDTLYYYNYAKITRDIIFFYGVLLDEVNSMLS